MKFAAFVRLSRLKFLIGGFLGGALGTAIAAYEGATVSLASYALAQFAITSAHYMTQLANEYYDRESDAQTERTPYSGGSGVLVDGSLQPQVALYGALVALGASVAGTVALFASGHAVAGLVAASIVPLAWAYSAPPFRLLARGLGEADSMLVVGALVPLCTYAAQTGSIDARAVATALPGAAAMLAMMIGVQLPDLRADAATGKRNLVVRIGAPRAARVGLAALAAVIVATATIGRAGVPATYAAYEMLALVPIGMLGAAFVQIALGRPFVPRRVAALGVGVFMLVTALGMLAYVVAAPAKLALAPSVLTAIN